jgi:hypothetical protein
VFLDTVGEKTEREIPGMEKQINTWWEWLVSNGQSWKIFSQKSDLIRLKFYIVTYDLIL